MLRLEIFEKFTCVFQTEPTIISNISEREFELDPEESFTRDDV